jgi:abortive infection bacteriophage resistance protein
MKYLKPPISIADQITKFKERGLIINNESQLAHYLSNISYYRLRAYTYPFQDNNNPNHPFIKSVSFEEIMSLYVFDRQLRLLIFNAIEKIEISLRTQIIYHYSIAFQSHWHLNPALYTNSSYFVEHISSLNNEITRSNETFIKHYKQKYTDPKEPPCWMSLEVTSMGLLSKIFKNLKNDSTKNLVVKHFGLKDQTVLESWMFCFSILRNICAHHGRVWNRRLPPIKLPKKYVGEFVDNTQIYTNKIYSYICCIQYILNIISPNHDFKSKLFELMSKCPLLQEKEMGFTKGWQNEKLWQ